MALSRPTRVIRWHVECKDHGESCTTYVLAGDTYGRLLGKTPLGELAEFSYWDDPVFAEVVGIVRELLHETGRDSWAGECFGRVAGVACDPAPSGCRYDFTGREWCSVCGSTNVSYGPGDPPEFEDIDVPLVTHNEWEGLSQSGKRERIMQALRDAGCICV